jgi:rod shape-determining protein MreD
MKRSIFYLLTVALVFWVQAAANYFAGVSGVSGNVILVATIYFGLARGPMSGQLLGFFWGLLIDASTLGLMGQNALLYAAAGFLAGMLRRQLDEDKGWTQVIFSFAASLLYILVHLTLEKMFAPAPRPPSWSMGVQPFINAMLAPIVFWMMRVWSQFWDLWPQEEE